MKRVRKSWFEIERVVWMENYKLINKKMRKAQRLFSPLHRSGDFSTFRHPRNRERASVPRDGALSQLEVDGSSESPEAPNNSWLRVIFTSLTHSKTIPMDEPHLLRGK